MSKGVLAACAVTAAAGLLAASAVGDQGGAIETKVSLENSQPGLYDGEVQSTKPACRTRRTVRVYHDQNRNGVDTTDYLIGTDQTDKRGEYGLDGSQAPRGDQIIALATRKKLSDGTRCLSDSVKAVALSG
jgi:hypothetical protein